MAENITIKELATSEKEAFAKALETDELTDKERAFVKDAISSWDYVLAFMSGDKTLPSPDEDTESHMGKRWGWLRGSILNIVLAENIVLGQWSNLTKLSDDDDDDEDDEDDDKKSGWELLKGLVKNPLKSKKPKPDKDKPADTGSVL